MAMKASILNSALPILTQQTGSGFWLSITHFTLAWASDEELLANPVSGNMTEIIQQTPSDNIVKGDIIYNIWQTPFAYKSYSGQFPRPNEMAEELLQGYGRYYQYEYDTCAKRNVLKPNQKTTYEGLSPNIKAYFDQSGNGDHSFYGYVNNGTTSSQLTVENTPISLDNEQVPPVEGLGAYSKLFPIKSYRPISQTDFNNSTIMNYNLNLPPMSSKYGDAVNFYANSIGNFKFNRVGLYMTKCAKITVTNTDDPKDVYIPMANEEPILFAVIDIGVQSCNGTDTSFDIYKTRDDSGFAGWDFDVQLPISTSVIEANTDHYTMYVDAIRDDATTFYQAQMLNNASMSQTIMQLQMMVLQLANRLEETTGVSMFSKTDYPGYDSEGIIEIDREYVLSRSSQNKRLLLDGLAFNGVHTNSIEYVNSANALFSLKRSTRNNPVKDGDFFKITIYNLDGYTYNVDGDAMPWWNGSIKFANYNEDTGDRVRIYEINSALLKGSPRAKVTLLFSYNIELGWVLESESIIDESKFLEANKRLN